MDITTLMSGDVVEGRDTTLPLSEGWRIWRILGKPERRENGEFAMLCRAYGDHGDLTQDVVKIFPPSYVWRRA